MQWLIRFLLVSGASSEISSGNWNTILPKVLLATGGTLQVVSWSSARPAYRGTLIHVLKLLYNLSRNIHFNDIPSHLTVLGSLLETYDMGNGLSTNLHVLSLSDMGYDRYVQLPQIFCMLLVGPVSGQ